jgi:taurine dioxygenase
MTTMTATRLRDALGIEIRGIDVTTLDDEGFQEVLRTWHDGQVLVVKEQSLSTDDQIAFARRFGELEAVRTRPDEPSTEQYVMYVANRPVEGSKGVLPNGEMNFHTDQCYYQVPCMATMLYGMEIPSQGGNTLFASACRAYDRLPEELKRRIAGLQAVQVYDYDGSPTQRTDKHSPDAPRWTHPVVTVHPATGRPVLFVNRLMTQSIVGLDSAASDDLLSELFSYIEAPDNVYEHVWEQGDLVLWDNRCTLHARTDFNPTEARVMRRVTVQGTQPVPFAGP